MADEDETKETDDAFDEAFQDTPASEDKAEETKAETAESADDTAQKETPPEEGAQEAATETKEAVAEKPASEQKQQVDPEQFKGYLDEREKRQQAEAKAEALKAQLDQFQQSQRKEEKPPDIYEDPEGYKQHLEGHFEQRMLAQKIEQSEVFARQQHGDELMDKVTAWAKQLPAERALPLQNHALPYVAAVEAYKREQAGETLKAHDYDLDKLKAAWLEEHKAAQGGETANAQPGETQTTATEKEKLPPKVANSGGVEGAKAPAPSDDDLFVSVFER